MLNSMIEGGSTFFLILDNFPIVDSVLQNSLFLGIVLYVSILILLLNDITEFVSFLSIFGLFFNLLDLLWDLLGGIGNIPFPVDVTRRQLLLGVLAMLLDLPFELVLILLLLIHIVVGANNRIIVVGFPVLVLGVVPLLLLLDMLLVLVILLVDPSDDVELPHVVLQVLLLGPVADFYISILEEEIRQGLVTHDVVVVPDRGALVFALRGFGGWSLRLRVEVYYVVGFLVFAGVAQLVHQRLGTALVLSLPNSVLAGLRFEGLQDRVELGLLLFYVFVRDVRDFGVLGTEGFLRPFAFLILLHFCLPCLHVCLRSANHHISFNNNLG